MKTISNMQAFAYAIITTGIIGCLVCMLMSCGTTTYTVGESPISDEDVQWNTLYPLARYDTSNTIKGTFVQGKSTIIYMQDSSCVVIWGKHCNFRKNEMLYWVAERWHNPGYPGSICKYFVTNEEMTIRYRLED